MLIQSLADRPEAISILAEWFFAEWHAFDGRSRAEIEVQLRGNLNRDCAPVTFLAVLGSKVIGTVSLDLLDLPAYDHLSPWLASLYVAPAFRRAGTGRALVTHLIAFAHAKEVACIHLWTPGSTRLYEQCGWRILEKTTYSGQPITIMRFVVPYPRGIESPAAHSVRELPESKIRELPDGKQLIGCVNMLGGHHRHIRM